MKEKILFCLFLGAFGSGIIFNMAFSVLVSHFSKEKAVACFDDGEEKSDRAKDAGMFVEELHIKTTMLSQRNREEGWDRDYRKMEIAFLLYSSKDMERGQHQRKVCAGDYFLYQIPEGFSLENHFSPGCIRQGKYIIATYKEIKNEYQEFIKITFTKFVGEEYRLYDISGKLVLELEEKTN